MARQPVTRTLRRRSLALLLGAALLLASFGPKTSMAETSDATAIYAEIDRYVAGQVDDSRLPGAALAIVQGGEIVHARGFGDGITADTPFAIGSLTKSFTALAVMQLAEAGQVDLDAPVQRYIPWFAVADPVASRQITVRHLLNQTSGLSRATGIAPLLEERDDTPQHYVRSLRQAHLNRPVGASYEYSNANYVVLGLLIETVSGQAYGDYIQTHVFDPLEMRDSYTSHAAGRQHGMAALHRIVFGVPVETTAPDLPAQVPTGFLVASARDMARYLTMYLNGGSYGGQTVLSPAGIATLQAPATNEFTRTLLSTTFTARYGMGWFAGSFGAVPDARWHLGELPSFNAWMVVMPERDQAVVVLINSGNQLEIAGANEVFSRLPIGVTNLLAGAAPPTGRSLTTFYLLFDALVVVLVLGQVVSLVRLARRSVPRLDRPHGGRELAARLRYTVPLAWEVGLGLLILLGYRSVTGVGWQANLKATPDLALVLIVMATLWLLTGVLPPGEATQRPPAAGPRPSPGSVDTRRQRRRDRSMNQATAVRPGLPASLRSGERNVLSLLVNSRAMPACALLVVLALLTWAGLHQLATPAVVPASAPATEFSAARAPEHLNVIAADTRVIGSPGHSAARQYLVEQLQRLGLQPDVQTTTVVLPGEAGTEGFAAATVHNVIARLPGTSSTGALALNAHYDSGPTGPGAMDAGSGVVTVRETVRALQAGPSLRNDLIIVFSDAEEVGMLGAAAFNEQHPWAADIRLALNFDAGGGSGPALLYTTSPDNRWLVDEYVDAVPHGSASSLLTTSADDLFTAADLDCDLGYYTANGSAGLGFVVVGTTSVYHTARDEPSAIDTGSIQQEGANTLAAVRHFGNLDLSALPRSGNAVFFNVWPGGVVHYPTGWVVPFSGLLTLLVAGLATMGLRRGTLTGKGLAGGTLAFLGGTLLATAIAGVT